MSGLNWERQKELAKLRMDRAEGDPRPWLTTLKVREEARKGMPRYAQLQTPTCPDCNKPMAVRVRKSDGKRFFGCRNYPECRRTEEIVKG